jgi:hypothetical protein
MTTNESARAQSVRTTLAQAASMGQPGKQRRRQKQILRRFAPQDDNEGQRRLAHDDINLARSGFLSRRLFREASNSGFSLRFERHGRFFAAARRLSLFAFSSQNAPKSAENYSTHSAGRNASQVIENNQKGYALLDTLRGSHGARNCERKTSEDPALHKPQGWAPPEKTTATTEADPSPIRAWRMGSG